MSLFREKEINYTELIPVNGVVTPKKLSMIFSSYYLEYGLGIRNMEVQKAGTELFSVKGIKELVYENSQIKYLGNRNWKHIKK